MVAVKAIDGPARSGKTASLISAVCDLLGAGVDPEDILLVTPGKNGAQALKEQLLKELGPIGFKLKTASARSVFFSQLAPAGGIPRILTDVEWSLLVSDLRGEGFGPDEIRDALACAQASWAQGLHPEYEEGSALDCLMGKLTEANAIAVAQLPTAVAELEEPRWSHVMVDDANALSHEAIVALVGLASEGAVLSGDSSWTTSFFDPAADGHAFVRLAQEVAVLPKPQGYLPTGVCYPVKFDTWSDEIAGAGAYALARAEEILEIMKAEAIEGDIVRMMDVEPDLAIVVPDAATASRVAAELRTKGFEADMLMQGQKISGDPRRIETCAGLKEFALQAIAADPLDVPAWRLIMSLGKKDMGRGMWKAVTARAEECGSSLREVLETIPASDDALGQSMRAVLDAANAVDAEAFASTVAEQFDRGFTMEPLKVKVCCPDALLGLPIGAVAVLGLNDCPAVDAATSSLLHAAAKATDELVISYVRMCEPERAERGRFVTSRMRTSQGQTYACLKPADAFPAMRRGGSSTLSGEQFLSLVLGLR